jgi:YkoY family integral membrane protein
VVADDAAIVVTLLMLEAVLSFDNAAVLAAMVRKLPIQDRRKALLYGLVGAYILRIAAILGAAFLIRTPELKIIGGVYLLFLGVKHFINVARHAEHHHKPHHLSGGFLLRLGMPALVAVIIQIELIDLAFAIDQVVVAVAFTDKIELIIIASMVGILFLRLAAVIIARTMDWLPLLEHMAYVAVAYVGVKLMLLYPFPFIGDGHGVHIPTTTSVAITLSLFGIPILLKLLFNWPRSHPGDHVAIAHPVTGGETQATVATLTEASRDVTTGPRDQPEADPPQQ